MNFRKIFGNKHVESQHWKSRQVRGSPCPEPVETFVDQKSGKPNRNFCRLCLERVVFWGRDVGSQKIRPLVVQLRWNGEVVHLERYWIRVKQEFFWKDEGATGFKQIQAWASSFTAKKRIAELTCPTIFERYRTISTDTWGVHDCILIRLMFHCQSVSRHDVWAIWHSQIRSNTIIIWRIIYLLMLFVAASHHETLPRFLNPPRLPKEFGLFFKGPRHQPEMGSPQMIGWSLIRSVLICCVLLNILLGLSKRSCLLCSLLQKVQKGDDLEMTPRIDIRIINQAPSTISEQFLPDETADRKPSKW